MDAHLPENACLFRLFICLFYIFTSATCMIGWRCVRGTFAGSGTGTGGEETPSSKWEFFREGGLIMNRSYLIQVVTKVVTTLV
jgi:hypothetical protein